MWRGVGRSSRRGRPGEGAGGGTPPAQLGGMGERCKLPHRGLGLRPRSQRILRINPPKSTLKLHQNQIGSRAQPICMFKAPMNCHEKFSPGAKFLWGVITAIIRHALAFRIRVAPSRIRVAPSRIRVVPSRIWVVPSRYSSVTVR